MLLSVFIVTCMSSLFYVPWTKGELSNCSTAIQDFLSKAEPLFDDTDKSLSLEVVDISDLYSHCGTLHISVELWRVISKPKIERPRDFGTPEYFSKDQHCENPNPDLLSKHGQARKASAWQQSQLKFGREGNNVVKFFHVVEKEYIIRLCPCQGGSHCTCESTNPGIQVCSSLFNIPNPEEDQVFPWCRGQTQPPQPKINSPIIQHCPAQLSITGIIPSCTTVRDYDQVEVILQAVYGHPTNCKDLPLPILTSSNRLESTVRLKAINQTHGEFEVDIKNITHDIYYCLRVELVNHPYCNSGADHSLDRQTKICRPALWNEPIFIAGHECGPPPPCPENRPNLPLITGASLAAALVLAIGLVLVHRLACRRKAHPPIPPHERGLLLSPPTPQYPDVFFLYFCDSEEFINVNKLVVRWLNGLGHRVLDLTDEVLQEELISNPETWITEKLENPNTKVVVVNSDLANCCIKSTEEFIQKDEMNALRIFSLKHIHMRLATNYRRLAVIQYRLDQSSSLLSLVPHTRHLLPDHLPELQAWLAETHGWDDNDNLESSREQTLRDLKAAVQKYTSVYK